MCAVHRPVVTDPTNIKQCTFWHLFRLTVAWAPNLTNHDVIWCMYSHISLMCSKINLYMEASKGLKCAVGCVAFSATP